jgi:hypothetical protein
MFARHYHKPYRLVCITDDPEGVECETYPLWDDHVELANPDSTFLSNYRRLKIFSKEMREIFGPRVLSLDLDCIIVNDITQMLARSETFVGIRLHKKTTLNRHFHVDKVYGGAMYLMDTGAHSYVWDEFDAKTSPQVVKDANYIGSDQAWMSYKLGCGHAVWTRRDGVLSFQNDGKLLWHNRIHASYARIIHFHGHPKPWDPDARKYQWVRDNWK